VLKLHNFPGKILKALTGAPKGLLCQNGGPKEGPPTKGEKGAYIKHTFGYWPPIL